MGKEYYEVITLIWFCSLIEIERSLKLRDFLAVGVQLLSKHGNITHGSKITPNLVSSERRRRGENE